MRGDSAAVESELERLRQTPAQGFSAYPVRVAEWGGDFRVAERAARDQTRPDHQREARLAGFLNLAILFTARGRWSQAEAELANAGRIDAVRTLEERAVLATLPFVPVPREDLEGLRRDLEAWTPPAAAAGVSPDRAYDRHARCYLLGLVASKLGGFATALAWADSLERLPDAAGTTVPGDLAVTVRASVAWLSGQAPDRVLGELAALKGHVPAVLWQDPVFAEEQARYARAAALVAAGRAEDALPWLQDTFTVTPGSLYYQAGVAYLEAEALDALSRPDEARRARERVAKLWAEADRGIELPARAW